MKRGDKVVHKETGKTGRVIAFGVTPQICYVIWDDGRSEGWIATILLQKKEGEIIE